MWYAFWLAWHTNIFLYHKLSEKAMVNYLTPQFVYSPLWWNYIWWSIFYFGSLVSSCRINKPNQTIQNTFIIWNNNINMKNINIFQNLPNYGFNEVDHIYTRRMLFVSEILITTDYFPQTFQLLLTLFIISRCLYELK